MDGPACDEQLGHPLSSRQPTPRSRRTVLGVPRSGSILNDSSQSLGLLTWVYDKTDTLVEARRSTNELL